MTADRPQAAEPSELDGAIERLTHHTTTQPIAEIRTRGGIRAMRDLRLVLARLSVVEAENATLRAALDEYDLVGKLERMLDSTDPPGNPTSALVSPPPGSPPNE